MLKRHYTQSSCARILCFSHEIDRCNAFYRVPMFIFNATDDNISCKIIWIAAQTTDSTECYNLNNLDTNNSNEVYVNCQRLPNYYEFNKLFCFSFSFRQRDKKNTIKFHIRCSFWQTVNRPIDIKYPPKKGAFNKTSDILYNVIKKLWTFDNEKRNPSDVSTCTFASVDRFQQSIHNSFVVSLFMLILLNDISVHLTTASMRSLPF